MAFAALAQAAVLPSFSIFGVQPNLVLVLLVAWLIVRPRREGLLLVPAAGLMVGLLDGEPLGLAMLALAPLILMAEVHNLHLVESDLLPAVAVAAAGTLVYEAIVLVTLAVTGERLDWLASVLDVLVPAAIANALLLLPVYGLMRLASMDLHGRRPAF
jgi:rod shape-determining protein MreD